MNFIRIFGRRFSTTSKTLKFTNVNKDIKYHKPNLDLTSFENKLRQVKTKLTINKNY